MGPHQGFMSVQCSLFITPPWKNAFKNTLRCFASRDLLPIQNNISMALSWHATSWRTKQCAWIETVEFVELATREGFNENYIATNIPTWMRFGYGIYLAPNSSKCHEYTQGAFDYRAMLVCDVAPGKKIVIALPTDDTYKELTKPPQSYDSIYGQGGCLNFEEIVVYECEKLMPRYIIVYQKVAFLRLPRISQSALLEWSALLEYKTWVFPCDLLHCYFGFLV